MKGLTVAWLLLAFGLGLTSEAHAQGTILFNNLGNSDASLDAPSNGLVFMCWCTNTFGPGPWNPVDQDVNFQLWAGSNGSSLQLIHTWLLSDGSAKGISAGAGHFADPAGAVYSIPGVQAGTQVYIEICAWPGNYDRILDAQWQGVPVGWADFRNPIGGNGAPPTSLVGMPTLGMSVVGPGAAKPALSISRSGDNVIVSWTNGPGFILQQTTSLGPGDSWTDMGTANPSAPIPITNTAVFFRARGP